MANILRSLARLFNIYNTEDDNTEEENIDNYHDNADIKEEDFYFTDGDTNTRIYIDELFKNINSLEYMNEESGLTLSLPYGQGSNCVYIMYDPRFLQLKTIVNIKSPKEYIYRGFYQICYKSPLDPVYRLAYYNYSKNQIRGDYKPLLQYFNIKPNRVKFSV